MYVSAGSTHGPPWLLQLMHQKFRWGRPPLYNKRFPCAQPFTRLAPSHPPNHQFANYVSPAWALAGTNPISSMNRKVPVENIARRTSRSVHGWLLSTGRSEIALHVMWIHERKNSIQKITPSALIRGLDLQTTAWHSTASLWIRCTQLSCTTPPTPTAILWWPGIKWWRHVAMWR